VKLKGNERFAPKLGSQPDEEKESKEATCPNTHTGGINAKERKKTVTKTNAYPTHLLHCRTASEARHKIERERERERREKREKED